MIINPRRIIKKKIVYPVEEKQVQPNGVDLRINRLFKIGKGFLLSEEKRELPIRLEIQPDKDGYFYIEENQQYEVEMKEIVNIPSKIAAQIILRSSLNRCSLLLISALYDSGYADIAGAVLYSFNCGKLKKGMRVGQIVFYKAAKSKMYNGIYQQQRLKRDCTKLYK